MLLQVCNYVLCMQVFPEVFIVYKQAFIENIPTRRTTENTACNKQTIFSAHLQQIRKYKYQQKAAATAVTAPDSTKRLTLAPAQ